MPDISGDMDSLTKFTYYIGIKESNATGESWRFIRLFLKYFCPTKIHYNVSTIKKTCLINLLKTIKNCILDLTCTR